MLPEKDGSSLRHKGDPIWTLLGLLFRAHPWHGVSVGAEAPEKVTTYIEIVPTDTVKYELDKSTGHLIIDRPQLFSNALPPTVACSARAAVRVLQARPDLVVKLRENTRWFRQALRAVTGRDGAQIWNFAGIDDTVDRLRDAGFERIEVDLVPDPIRLEPGEQLEVYLATVMMGVHLRELPAERRRPLVHAVAERLEEPVIDYMRLQVSAVRPA